MSRYCSECGATANGLGPFCAACGGRVRTRGARPIATVGAGRQRASDRFDPRPARRTWDEEFEALEGRVAPPPQGRPATHVRRAAQVRPRLASEVRTGLAAVGLTGVILGLSAWLIVLRPSGDAASQRAAHAAAPAASKRASRPQPAARSTPTKAAGQKAP
jgi:hypothetical protein